MTMIAGKNINLQGIFQDTEIVGSKIYLNASFQNLKIQAEEIVLGPQAKILGNLNYSSKQKIPALEALVVGTKTFEALDTHMSETKNRISNNFWSIIVGFLGYKFFFLVIF